jgi:hypothetical protein
MRTRISGSSAGLWPHLKRAIRWLADQDANQFTLIDSPSGGDWMDSTLQRSGKLLYVNALYHRALLGMAELSAGDSETYRTRAALLRRKIDLLLWPEPGTDHGELLEGPATRHAPTRASPTRSARPPAGRRCARTGVTTSPTSTAAATSTSATSSATSSPSCTGSPPPSAPG